MSVLPASADFTDMDFESIRLRMIALIRSVFPQWTDFSVVNFGNILYEMFAWVGDVLTFTQDNQALESRIVTAQQRRNLLALVKLLNYTPRLATAATANETFTATGLAFDATIPAGFVVKTPEDGITFQLLSALLLTPGAPSATGTVENSTTQTQAYSGTGQPGQNLVLPLNPFLSVVSVSYDAGGDFTRVDNFLFSGPTDKVYTLAVDNGEVATVSFGDGVNGTMPSGAITATYKTGGGAAGNVATGSITQVDSVVLDTHGNLVNLTATNGDIVPAQDRESSASIRLRAPLSITNPTSSIARSDFEAHAVQISGIDRALMLTTNEDDGVPDNSGNLYIVPTGNPPVAPDNLHIEQVRLQFEGGTQSRPPFPFPLTFHLNVLPPVYRDVTLSMGIYLKRGANSAIVGTAIRAAYLNFFNPIVTDSTQAATLGVEVGARNPLIDFGYYLRLQNLAPVSSVQFGLGYIELSDLMDVVHDVPGVRGIGALDSQFLVNGSHTDVALAPKEFPRIAAFGAIVVTDLDTGVFI